MNKRKIPLIEIQDLDTLMEEEEEVQDAPQSVLCTRNGHRRAKLLNQNKKSLG